MKNSFIKQWIAGTLASFAASAMASTYYVAPNGNDSLDGSINMPWKSIMRAQQTAVAGDTVYFRGGTYVYSAGINTCATRTDTVNAITLSKSGTSGNPIRYWAYGTEVPLFDFTSMLDDCRVKSFNVVASWLHLKGLEIKGAPQQPQNTLNHESWGVWVNGSNNVFEKLNIHHVMGTGFFLLKGSNNLILNSDSHHNYDPYTSNGAGQSGDGFGAHIAANSPGNVFRGCRAWSNSDDGFDLINAYSAVVIENSWAWLHGYLPGTTTPLAAGNGNGFKIGGFGGVYVASAPKHVVRNSVAFRNKAAGFYANHHPVANDYFNNTGYNNYPNFNMLGIDVNGVGVNLGTLRNNISYGGTLYSNISGANMRYNSWDTATAVTVSDADFQSVAMSGWDVARAADGSLPTLNKLRLVSTSDLIDKGGNVKIAYLGAAPDLGAFEAK